MGREIWDFILARYQEIAHLSLQHLEITAFSVGCAIIFGVPLGIGIARKPRMGKWLLQLANVLQTIPSLALFGLLIPFLGIGKIAAVFVLFLYALLPILKNTYMGLESIEPSIIEAAKGIGMTSRQTLFLVEFPLALPIIMGGIRISTVINIGTATIAAYIGAGGLGDFIFRGIALNDNMMLLAGAVPAAVLALLADYSLGMVEQTLLNRQFQNRRVVDRRIKLLKRLAILILSFIILSVGFAVLLPSKKQLVIGYKADLEGPTLAQIQKIFLEKNTDFEVQTKALGSTFLAFQALKNNDIDTYVEYTGTAYQALLHQDSLKNPQQIYQFLKDSLQSGFGIQVLTPLGFNNTYAFAMKDSVAEQLSIKSISDMGKKASQLRLVSTIEFQDRQQDGLPGVERAYGFQFKEVINMESEIRYLALMSDQAEVVVVYTTDSQIRRFNLRVLKDDKKFFPPYEAVSFVGENLEKEAPEVIKWLNMLGGKINNDQMIQLNYEVSEKGMKEEKVARQFLLENGLL
ncbi:glycine betaine ABC transporter substrate-binding protein [Xanthovirga aplysinae]|uniref:glycine betaine ABC transporter substrate-binding protein n=1 Tax=Xanthovirga aplysinae TaxID=2529853 RepID=UPI001656D5BF|nr:glycine betaine ABC transporter substrate-binding protein [Xanthovirga aplysinae]